MPARREAIERHRLLDENVIPHQINRVAPSGGKLRGIEQQGDFQLVCIRWKQIENLPSRLS